MRISISNFNKPFTNMQRKTLSLFVLSLLLAVLLWLTATAGYAQFSRLTTADGLSDNQVQHVEQLADGRMLVVTGRCINLYDGRWVQIIPREDILTLPLPHHRFGHQVLTDRHHCVWVKEFGRLWCLDLRRGCLIPPTNGWPFAAHPALAKGFTDIYMDSDHHLWLLTADGLHSTDGATAAQLNAADRKHLCAVDADSLRLYLFMADGSVSVISRKTGKPHQRVAAPAAHTAQHNCRVLRASDGSFYRLAESQQTYIDRFDTHTLRWQPVIASSMVLYNMGETPDGHLLVSSRHGLLDLGATPTFPFLPSESSFPTAITTHVPARFITDFPTDDGRVLHDVVFTAFCFTPQGDIWLGLGDYGLLHTHPLRHRIRTASTPASLGISDQTAQAMHQRLVQLHDGMKQADHDVLTDRHGRTWHATHTGLLIATDTDTLHLTTADGLPSNYVFSLAEDQHGNVWAATNQGLVRTDGHHVTTFSREDGWPEWEFLHSSAACLPDGRMAFQALEGWVAFSPDSIDRPAMSQPVRLVGISVNDRPLHGGQNAGGITLHAEPPYTDHLDLTYQQNNVTLLFSAFDYAFPHQVTYRWRMVSGRDTTWHKATQTQTQHGNLQMDFLQVPPGHYRLEVEASSDGTFAPLSRATLRLHIAPPWWQTWWAYILYIIGAAFLIGIIFYTYLRHQRRMLEWQRKEEVLMLRIKHLMEVAPLSDSETAPLTVPERDAVASTTEAPSEAAGGDTTLGDEDRAFVQRVTTLIEQHISESYTVEQLASDLCMERTGLYKRLTSIVSQTPQLFIRSVRIRRACTLLLEGQMNVTEISEAVGFSSPSYMRTCFQKELGCTPLEWRERQQFSTSANPEINTSKSPH